MKDEEITYSNPRIKATFNDWPYGKNRVQCIFTIEGEEGKQRATRTTENPRGGWNKPKKTTYSTKARIVDGSDGRTYIAELSLYGNVCIRSSDMKHDIARFYEDHPQFAAMAALFE